MFILAHIILNVNYTNFINFVFAFQIIINISMCDIFHLNQIWNTNFHLLFVYLNI